MTKRPYFRERTPNYRRSVGRFSPRQQFLIVCEGAKTEPNYFLGFPIPPDSIVDVEGVGMNTVRVVREAMRLRKEKKYDQVWAVFDRDNFPAENFNAALELAQQQGIRVAYSNEAFELWYVLHFNYLDTGISRADYCERLSGLLGHPYAKNDPNTYAELLLRQPVALRNAQTLLSTWQPPHPESDKPSTTVHVLVTELNKLKWDFSER